jgi:hypothetical protein
MIELLPTHILFITTSSSIILGLYSAWRPMAIIPCYFFLYSFFIEGTNFVSLYGLQFGPSLVFLCTTTGALLLKRWGQERDTFKVPSKMIFLGTPTALFLSAYIASYLLPAAWHYFWWENSIPWQFLKIHSYALWGCIMLLVSREDIDLQNFRRYSAIFAGLLVIIYAPQSILFFESSGGMGFGRMRHIESPGHPAAPYFADIHIIKISHKNMWFQMSLMGSFAVAILTSGIVSYFLENLYQKKAIKLAAGLVIFLLFEYVVIYINQYFLLVVIFNAVILNGVIVAIIYRKSLPMGLGQLAATSAFIVGFSAALFYVTLNPPDIFRTELPYIDQIQVQVIDQIQVQVKEVYGYKVAKNRSTLIADGSKAMLQQCFWFGCNLDAPELTHHSDILDRMIAFGVLFGLLSNFIPLFFGWLFFRRKSIAQLSFGEYLFGINLFLAFLLCSFGGIFSSQQSNLALMIGTGLLFLRAMGERERLVSLNGDSRDKVTQSQQVC